MCESVSVRVCEREGACVCMCDGRDDPIEGSLGWCQIIKKDSAGTPSLLESMGTGILASSRAEMPSRERHQSYKTAW